PFYFHSAGDHRALHSFPTRRSSDLRGSTSVWYDENKKRSFEWGPWSLFAIPMNANYQHFNVSGTEPARYIALTTAPTMMNFVRDDEFIFNNPFGFKDRYDQEQEYFNAEVKSRMMSRVEGGRQNEVHFS